MQLNDLVESGVSVSYDGGMTDQALWAAVGVVLASRRVEAGYATTRLLAQSRHDSPNERTLDAIENGRPGNVTSLSEYCAILGVSLPSVLASVLPGAAVSAAAMGVAERFDQVGPQTRQAVRAVLLIEPPTPPTPRSAEKAALSRTRARTEPRRQKA